MNAAIHLPMTAMTLVAIALVARLGAAADVRRCDVYVAAHPDDWQLFMGERAVADINRRHRVVFIYLTSGDSGLDASYWRARERGANASVQFAAELRARRPGAGGPAACGTTVINAHPIWRCRYARTRSYFLRLPDGAADGGGFEQAGHQSLSKLEDGRIPELAAVDGSTAYRSWDDVCRTIRDIIREEGRGHDDRMVRVTAPDPDATVNPRDHSDHHVTGRAVATALARTRWNRAWCAGYDIYARPANLDNVATMHKMSVFMAYERQVWEDAKHSTYGEYPELYGAWLLRTYCSIGAERKARR